ncbi:hypothetical protein QQ045_033654 [Rhodiola kirilowii]
MWRIVISTSTSFVGEEYGQEHVFGLRDELSDDGRNLLLDDIEVSSTCNMLGSLFWFPLGSIFHLAEKINPTVHSNTLGLELEQFIYDAFTYSSSTALFEILLEEEFAPVKNANGSRFDTPGSAWVNGSSSPLQMGDCCRWLYNTLRLSSIIHDRCGSITSSAPTLLKIFNQLVAAEHFMHLVQRKTLTPSIYRSCFDAPG